LADTDTLWGRRIRAAKASGVACNCHTSFHKEIRQELHESLQLQTHGSLIRSRHKPLKLRQASVAKEKRTNLAHPRLEPFVQTNQQLIVISCIPLATIVQINLD
jgi:hypothetical protein